MNADPLTLLTFVAMGLVTYFTRIAGFFLADRLKLQGRAAAAFDAIPPAVLIAVIAPTALATGPAETIAALIAAAVSTRVPLLATIAIGVVAVVVLRAVI